MARQPSARIELQALRERLGGWQPSPSLGRPGGTLLAALLPDVPPGTLLEVLASQPGSGASTLAFGLVRDVQQASPLQAPTPVVVVDPLEEFCPAGAARLGLDLAQTLVVRPSPGRETLWAVEQSLRSASQCIVICRMDHLGAVTYRRLKLAAEQGPGRGVFLRSARFQTEPSWADVRLLVEPLPVPPQCSSSRGSPVQSRRLRVHVLHVKGGGFQQPIRVIDVRDETGAVSLAAELAHPTAVVATA